jgi:hypothetical protein
MMCPPMQTVNNGTELKEKFSVNCKQTEIMTFRIMDEVHTPVSTSQDEFDPEGDPEPRAENVIFVI